MFTYPHIKGAKRTRKRFVFSLYSHIPISLDFGLDDPYLSDAMITPRDIQRLERTGRYILPFDPGSGMGCAILNESVSFESFCSDSRNKTSERGHTYTHNELLALWGCVLFQRNLLRSALSSTFAS